MYPKSLESLINSFMRLPGVGRKTAERYAYSLLNSIDTEKIDSFISSLSEIKGIKMCNHCGFLTDNDVCDICLDSSRDKSIVLVVEEPKDVIAIERCNN